MDTQSSTSPYLLDGPWILFLRVHHSHIVDSRRLSRGAPQGFEPTHICTHAHVLDAIVSTKHRLMDRAIPVIRASQYVRGLARYEHCLDQRPAMLSTMGCACQHRAPCNVPIQAIFIYAHGWIRTNSNNRCFEPVFTCQKRFA